MAAAFNLTAQINLRGPTNTRAIASSIRKQLSNIKVKVDLDVKGASAKNLANINKQLKSVRVNALAAGKSLKGLNVSAQQMGATFAQAGNQSTQSLAKTQKQVSSAGKSVSQATSQIQEFGKQSGLAIRRFAAFSAVTGVVYSLTNAINSAFKEFVQFDRQIVRLSQVTGTSIASLSGISNEITKLSTNLGVASADLATVSVTLAQAGLSAQEAKDALEALAKSSLAPTFDNISNTAEGAIAAMRQFGITSNDLEGALGSINAVAANFAVEAGDIIKAIQRTGGVFASSSRGISSGTDALNEFVAVFTSVRATTRESAETISTGLRTIFTRIQRGSTIDALKEFGVTLTDLEGKFVGPFEAIKRLSEGLSGLDPRDLRFSQIVEELGGFRQIGKVIPLLQQFATAQDALAVAQGGQGSLAKNAAQAQASLAVQFEKTRQSFVALIRDIGNSATFQGIAKVSLLTANSFITLAGALKPLLPMLTALAAIKGASILSEFGGGFLGGLGKGGGGGGGGGSRGPSGGGSGGTGGAAAGTSGAAALSANTTALSNTNSSLANLIQSVDALTAAMSNQGPATGMRRGGPVGGTGSGDTVPAMLEPGEFVIRKSAVQAFGSGNLSKINKYAGGGAVRAGLSSMKNIKIDDGDTFSATVTPNAEPFDASFRLWGYDAYETGGKPSRISNKRRKQIQNIPGNENISFERSSSGYLIPSSARVDSSSRLTANGAADQATDMLQSRLGQTSTPQLIEAINKTLDQDGAFGRYAADIGDVLPDRLTTGRYGRKKMAKGGGISGSDTVPAMLTPGEFVVNKKAAQAFGYGNLKKINGYAQGGVVKDGVQHFANGGTVQADRMEYLARVADRLGITVEQYEKKIRAKILDSAERSSARKGKAKVRIEDTLTKNMSKIGDADVESTVREELSTLISKIDPKIDDAKLDKTINDIVKGMKDGLSIEEIRSSSNDFVDIMDRNVSVSAEVVDAQERAADKLGFITSKMKVRDLDLRAKQSSDSNVFGAVDRADPRAAQLSIESGLGQALDGFGEKLSTASIPGMKMLSRVVPGAADKITKMGDKIGGVTGILGTGATLLATQMPKIGEAFDGLFGTVSEGSTVFAGLTGALQQGGSQALSGAVLGGQAFGRRGAAIGGTIGAVGGGLAGFITESTAKSMELAMKKVTETNQKLSETFTDLSSARTFQERQSLTQEAEEEFQDYNKALRAAAQEVKDNRVWNALSGSLNGMVTAANLAATALISLSASGGGIGLGFGGGRRRRSRRRPFATGGRVPVKLAAGEGVFEPPLPYSDAVMQQMNQADRNGLAGKFSMVPGFGSGEVDTFNTSLAEGSFVVRAKAMRAIGAAHGGKIGGLGSVHTRAGMAAGGAVGMKGGGGLFNLLLIVELLSGLIGGIRGFFDNSQQEAQLKADLAQLDALQEIAANTAAFNVSNQAFADNLMNVTDPIEQANLTNDQRDRAYGRMGDARAGTLNDANLMMRTQIRSDLDAQGFNIKPDQSVQDFLNELKTKDIKAYNKAIKTTEQSQKELAKRIYIENRTRAGVDAVQAEKEFNQTDAASVQKRDAIIEKELGRMSRAEALAKRMASISRDVEYAVLTVTDVMNRLSGAMEKITSEIISNTDRMMQVSDTFSGGQAVSGLSDDRSVRVLENIASYTAEELDSVLNNVNAGLGNTPETRQMAEMVKGLQVIEKELPLILRESAQGGIAAGEEANVRSRVSKMFEGIGLGSDTQGRLEDSIMDYIQDSTGNRQGQSFEELADNFEGLKELNDAANKARETFAEYARKQIEMNAKLGQVSDKLSAQFDKLNDNMIKTQKIQLDSAVQLNEQLNKTLSFGDLTAGVNAQVTGLTGGISDANVIGQKIAEAIAQKRALEADPNTQMNALGSGQIAKLTSRINKYQRALDILATSTDKASAALKKIDEQQRISSGRRRGVMDLFANIDNPEALATMSREQGSFSRVMDGGGNLRDISQGLNSLNQLESVRTPEEFARLQEQFFNNAVNILQAQGGDPAVLDRFRDAFGKDFAPAESNPQIAPFIEIFKKSVEEQKAAINAQSNLITQGAEISANVLKTGAENFAREMANATKQIVAELNKVADKLGIGGAGGMATGGMVYASTGKLINFQPKGTDTVPAMLTPGEFVVNRAATQKNLPLLKSINSGTAGVEYRAGGGQIGNGIRTVYKNFNQLSPYDPKSLDNYEDNKDLVPFDYIGQMKGNKDGKISTQELGQFNRLLQDHEKKYFSGSQVARFQMAQNLLPKWQEQDKEGKFSSGSFSSLDAAENFISNMSMAHGLTEKDVRSKTSRGTRNRGSGIGEKLKPVNRFYGGDPNFPIESGIQDQFRDMETRTFAQIQGDRAEAFMYGLAKSALPALLGIGFGGLGIALGGMTTFGAGAPVGGFVGGFAGGALGEYINQAIWNSLLTDSIREHINEKIEAHPNAYFSGQVVGFGAELAGGPRALRGVSRLVNSRVTYRKLAHVAAQKRALRANSVKPGKDARSWLEWAQSWFVEEATKNSSKSNMGTARPSTANKLWQWMSKKLTGKPTKPAPIKTKPTGPSGTATSKGSGARVQTKPAKVPDNVPIRNDSTTRGAILTGQGLGQRVTEEVGPGYNEVIPETQADENKKPSTGRGGVVTYTDWTEPAERTAQRILETMAPKDVRMAFNTDDGKYKYGQVKESKELGFLDPLGLAKFTARYASLPKYELGNNELDNQNLLSMDERRQKEKRLKELEAKFGDYADLDTSDPKTKAEIEERNKLNRQLEADYQSQFALGVPTEKPVLKAKPPLKPTMPARFGPFGPTLEQIKKAKDNSALKDLTKLTELDANLKSPPKDPNKKDEDQEEGAVDPAKLNEWKQKKTDLLNKYGASDSDSLRKILEKQTQSARETLRADEQMKQFREDKKKYKVAYESYLMDMERYQNRNALNEDPTLRMGGELSPQARKEKEARAKELNEKLKRTGVYNSETIKAMEDEKRYIEEQLKNNTGGFSAVPAKEYNLFNHKGTQGVVAANPFSFAGESSGNLFGMLTSGENLDRAREAAKVLQATVLNNLNNYGKSVGIKGKVNKNTDMKKWIEALDPAKISSISSTGGAVNLVGEELKNLAVDGTGSFAAEYGLWSSVGIKNGFNQDFHKQYRKGFIDFLRGNLKEKSDEVEKQRKQTPDDLVNRLKQAVALENYTKKMDRKIYKRASEGAFRPIRIKKNLGLKDLRKEINIKYRDFRNDNLNKPFGFNKNFIPGWEKAMDKYNIRGLSPEALREIVLADSFALSQIAQRREFALNGGLTPKSARSIGGQANLLAGSKNEKVGMADAGALTDTTENTTLIGLLKNALNFSTFMTDRQSRFDSFKSADLSKGVGPTYKKYEKDLDNNVSSIQKAFNVWDSLYSYMIQGDSSIVESVNADGILSKISKTKGDYNIGGASVSGGSNFLNSYEDVLTTLGKTAYDQIEAALAQIPVGGINAALPFNNASFIASMKEKQLQETTEAAPKKATTKAMGGIIPNYLNNGALVNYQPQGTDTVPAMLTPGEFVVNRAATQKNLPLLRAINRGGTQYASNGGIISPAYYENGALVSGSGSGGGYGIFSTVFDDFISSFNRETNNLGGLINNLARVFPALSGPVSAFGGHISRFERAIDRLSNVEIQGPSIPDTININSDTIRVELIAPSDSSYSLSDEDRNQITEQLTNRLRSLTTMGR